MEIRDIEIFLTLAEELHFGRAAERLHVTPSRVSKSVAKQERLLGAELFERSSRRVALTAIGARLRDDLESGHRHILEAIESARAAARGESGILTLGAFTPSIQALATITERFTASHPDCELLFREVPFSDPFGPLRAGEVDIQACWLPVRDPELSVGPVLFTQDVRLLIATWHPLAVRETVSLEDLADYAVPSTYPQVPVHWEESLNPFHTPSGRPIPRGPRIGSLLEILALVAGGRIVCPVYSGIVEHVPYPGVTSLPVRDAPAGRWALVWRTAGETPLVRAYARVAVDTAPAVELLPVSRSGRRGEGPPKGIGRESPRPADHCPGPATTPAAPTGR
jgi:DNA-binding transcriptional LysR family regulator